MPLLLVFLVQGLFLAILCMVALSHSPPARLLSMDGVSPPGLPATVGVRIDREDPPLSRGGGRRGIRVIFESLGRLGSQPVSAVVPAGIATSDEAGFAELPITAPAEPGTHRFRARIEGSGDRTTEPGVTEVLLDVVPADRALLFVLLPGSPASDPLFAPPLPGVPDPASAALAGLAAGRAIIYVSRGSPRAARAWVADRGFPPGAILLAGLPNGLHTGRPGDEKRGLRGLIAGLDLARWKGPHWAITTSFADAGACALAGARALFLGQKDARGHAPIIQAAADWSEAVRIIQSSETRNP